MIDQKTGKKIINTFQDFNRERAERYFKLKTKKENWQPNGQDLLSCCIEIKKFDPLSPNIPKSTHSLEQIWNWYAKHFTEYETFLYSLIEKK